MLIGDSAYPPASYPTEFQGQPVVGWCVYIGGNTPHVWTEQEIAHLKAQPWCRYILPVFVRSNPGSAAQAKADAQAAIAWSKAHGQPAGTLVMWDYETAVNSAYELTVDATLHAGDGDLEILYGSKSTVVNNARPSGGYDEASWTGADYAPVDTAAQFGDFGAYDLNDFTAGAAIWDLRPTPAAPAAPQEDDVSRYEKTCNAATGRAGIGFAAGECKTYQISFDPGDVPAGQTVTFDMCIVLGTGPVVVAEKATAPHGKLVVRCPEQFVEQASGVIAKCSLKGLEYELFAE